MDVDESWWTVSATDSQLERERDGFLEILLDLIAELRDIYEDMGGGWDLKEAADRAEARLSESNGVAK